MLIIGIPLLAQEKIMSDMESYYDFLALDGFTERAYLNYRTLSDSKWTVNQQAGDMWKQQIDFQKVSRSKALKIYGPNVWFRITVLLIWAKRRVTLARERFKYLFVSWITF